MPLDRAHMTAAEAITLRLYPAAYTVLGVIFLIQDPERTSAPSFAAAKMVLPMKGWALVFIALALVEVAALLWHHRRLYVYALTVGAGIAAFWMALAVASAAFSTLASFSGSVWVAIATGAQIASARMLANRDVPALGAGSSS